MPHDASTSDLQFDGFRSYLTLLARAGLGGHLQAKVDASDVVQQTLLEAHQASGQFRGTSTAERAVWLRQILARNLASLCARFRREKRDVKREQSLEQVLEQSAANLGAWLTDGEPSPSQHVQREESAVRVAMALDALPDNQREAVVLRHFEGRSLTEIGAALNCSTAAVAGLIYRGLKMMRRQLKEQE